MVVDFQGTGIRPPFSFQEAEAWKTQLHFGWLHKALNPWGPGVVIGKVVALVKKWQTLAEKMGETNGRYNVDIPCWHIPAPSSRGALHGSVTVSSQYLRVF